MNHIKILDANHEVLCYIRDRRILFNKPIKTSDFFDIINCHEAILKVKHDDEGNELVVEAEILSIFASSVKQPVVSGYSTVVVPLINENKNTKINGVDLIECQKVSNVTPETQNATSEINYI